MILQVKDFLNGKDKSKKWKGVCLLNIVLKTFETNALEEHILSWIRNMMQIINTMPPEKVKTLCLKNLAQLLILSVNNDKLAREISASAVDLLLNYILASKNNAVRETFILLSVCIENYPGPCGRYRDDIEKLILGHVYSSSLIHSLSAAQCFPLISHCGSGGEQNRKRSERYCLLLQRLLRTIHHITDVIEARLYNKEGLSEERSGGMLDYPILDINFTDFLIQAPHVLEKLLLILRSCFSKGTIFKCDIPIQYLISVFTKTCSVLQMPKVELFQEDAYRRSLSLYSSLLQTICSAIEALSTLLIPCSSPLIQILMIGSGLKDCRSVFYQCVTMILCKWKGFAAGSKCVQQIISIALDDVLCNSRTNNDHIVSGTKNFKQNLHLNAQDTYSALVMLEELIVSSGSTLSKDSVLSILSCFINAIKNIYVNGCASVYSKPSLRIALFTNIHALVNLHHHLVNPKPLLVSFLSFGLEDPCDAVKVYCQKSFSLYDMVIHPANPTFRYQPIPVENMDAVCCGINEAEQIGALQPVSNKGNETSAIQDSDLKRTVQLRSGEVPPKTLSSHVRSHSPPLCEVVETKRRKTCEEVEVKSFEMDITVDKHKGGESNLKPEVEFNSDKHMEGECTPVFPPATEVKMIELKGGESNTAKNGENQDETENIMNMFFEE